MACERLVLAQLTRIMLLGIKYMSETSLKLNELAKVLAIEINPPVNLVKFLLPTAATSQEL